MIKIIIIIWSYILSILQFSAPFNIAFILFSYIFYIVLFLGIRKKILPERSIRLISVIGFCLTFGLFWSNIIYILLYFANLIKDANVVIFIINSLVYMSFYILFNRDIQNLTEIQTTRKNVSKNSVKLLVDLTFPILASIFVFFSTLYIFSLITDIGHGIAVNDLQGITLLIHSIIITIIFSYLVNYYFEEWVDHTSEKNIKIAFLFETSIGIILAILISTSSLIK